MYAEHGWRSFYRGMAPTLLGILPYAGISFATYGSLKAASEARKRDAAGAGGAGGAGDPLSPPPPLSSWERLAFGGIAGLAGQASTYPLDIVRRRMQTEGYTELHAHVGLRAAAARALVGGKDAAAAAHAHAHAHAPAPPAAPAPASAASAPGPSALRGLAARLPRSDGGMLETLMIIYRHEGRRGLFKGLSMNVIKGPIAVGISFTTYDLLKKLLNVEE
jgi:hypothetical protein